jgi:acetyl-CoA C-acetyltransferase
LYAGTTTDTDGDIVATMRVFNRVADCAVNRDRGLRRRAEPILAVGARTPVCREGGSLRDVPAVELALAAGGSVLSTASVSAAELGSVVVAAGIPGSPRELGLAAEVRDGLEAAAAVAVQVGGVTDTGLGALTTAAASLDRGPALVIGVESSSRAPYWSGGLRSGAARNDAEVVDPLGAVLAAQGRRGESVSANRESEDALALRSHARTAAAIDRSTSAASLDAVASVAGVEDDELPAPERSPEEVAALKPVFDEEGTVTVASTGLPADGAAAVLINAAGEGPTLQACAPGPEAALALAGRGPHEIATAEIYESTAADVLAVADSIGIDLEIVNPDGGAIGQGSPFSASGILMALRLGSRLRPDEVGLLAGPGRAAVLVG